MVSSVKNIGYYKPFALVSNPRKKYATKDATALSVSTGDIQEVIEVMFVEN